MESPVLVQMDVTQAERQMVEAIRKLHEPRDASRFYLEVKLDDGGAWEVNMAVTIIDHRQDGGRAWCRRDLRSGVGRHAPD